MKLLEHFHKLSIYPNNAKELKGLVLQLAVQGKLTADWRLANPDVEPAAVLLERIKVEKQELIKAKKIKKEKALPAIEADEIPYTLPDGWVWCRLGDVFQIGSSKRIFKSDYVTNGIPFYRSKEIGELSKSQTTISRLFISEEKYQSLIEKIGIPRAGDLLITSVGSIGNTWIVDSRKFYYKDGNITQLKGHSNINMNYVQYFINSPVFTNEISGKISGTAYSALTIIKLKRIIFPLPPLQEQKAIVKIVDTLLQEVAQLEQLTQQRLQLKEKYVTAALNQVCEENTTQAWTDLKGQFSTFFNEEGNIKKLRETILQLAVQGKLTANWRLANPDVEPAAVLLERIKAEKQELIKAKKIKKEKALPAIEADEIPYTLPEGWVWCRLGNTTTSYKNNILDGPFGSNLRSNEYVDSGVPIIRLQNIQRNQFLFKSFKYITKEKAEFLRKHNYKPGDVVICKLGSPTGKACIIPSEMPAGRIVADIVRFRAEEKYLFNQYLCYALNSPMIINQFNSSATGITRQRVNLSKIRELVFPIASLSEQKAIVKKVNQLMTFCDTLEQEVIKSKEAARKLMQVVLKEVFEGNLEVVQ